MRSASAKTKRTIVIVLSLALVAAFALVAATSGLGSPTIPDGDVAIVDDVDDGTVSQEDFDRGMDQAAAQLGLEEPPPPNDPQYQQILDQAMQELLLAIWVEGEAADRGITVTDDEIADELATIKEQSFGSEKEFERFKEESQFTDEDIDRQVELTLLRDQLEAEIVPERPEITDDEVEAYYESNIEAFGQPASRDVRVILNSSEAKVEQAKEELTADDSDAAWQAAAKKYSQDQASSDRGGLLEGLVEGQGDPELEAEAFAAPEGELVGPFETERGFYLLQVQAITEASTQPLEEASKGIRQQLASARQQRIASDFQTDFVNKWTARTFCEPEVAVQLCDGFEAPEPEQVPGQPEQPEPPPVVSTQPIEPGTAALSLDGSAAQGLPQAPQGGEPAVPEGTVPIPPSGTAAPPPGAAPPPAGAAPAGAAP